MGYESKVYIVQKDFRPVVIRNGFQFAPIVSMMDLGKAYPLLDVFTTPTKCYIYANGGEDETIKDCYGDPLKEAGIDSVIERLENILSGDDDRWANYWKFKVLLATLREYQSAFPDSGWADSSELVVLHYGH